MTVLSTWVSQTWAMMAASAPWLLFGFLLAGGIHVLVPVGQVSRHLGARGLGGVLKACLVGLPLPLCSCSVIPVASSLRKRGAGRGATAAFLISTPESGADSIAVSYALLGPFLAIARPLAALITALVAGWLIHWSETGDAEAGESTTNEPEAPCCSSGGCGDAANGEGGLIGALRFGLVEMFSDLAHWLAVGFLLGGLLGAVLPNGYLEQHVGNGVGPMLIMLIVGLPMYVCATSSTPVAAALIAGGLSPGAVLVFLLAGPATNVATVMVVLRDLGHRALVVYVASISIVAVASGVCTNLLLESSVIVESTPPDIEHAGGWVSAISAVVLVALMVNGMGVRIRRSADNHAA